MNFLGYFSLYLSCTSVLLLFMCSAGYESSEGIVEYKSSICNFYDVLFGKLSIDSLSTQGGFIASFKRHFLCKKYLKNTSKLIALGVSELEAEQYKENIMPILMLIDYMFKLLIAFIIFSVIFFVILLL